MERIFTNSAPQGPLANSVTADMDEVDLYEHTVRSLIEDAVDFEESNLAPVREVSQRYYYGLEPRLSGETLDEITGDPPIDDETDPGRSTVVSTDVRDTIMAILPSLMRIFMGSEHAVEYVSNDEQGVELAAQATDYVRLKLWHHNDGFLVLHGAFKDALTTKIGVVTWWTDETPKITEKTFSGVTQDQLGQIMTEGADMAPKIVSYDPPKMGKDGVPIVDNVVIRFTKSRPQLKIMGVPPEEFRVNRGAKSVKTADLIGHECYVRVSEMVAKGFDEDFVRSLAGTFNDWSAEKDLRNPGVATSFALHDYVKYGAFYVRADKDGDGINELRLIITLGENYEIVSDEYADEPRFAVFCPDPTPHTLVGDSESDITMDMQRINTNLLRAGLDSLADAIFPRTAINELLTNVEDAMNDDIGGIIRTKGDPANSVMSITTPFVGQSAFDAFGMMSLVRQQRTGISEASKGVDPKALQSTTVMGVDAIVSGAQERIELIARVFAETGMKDLYRGVLKEITQYPNMGEVVKLRGKWVQVDPSLYDPSMTVEVNPALGKGSDADRLAALMMVKETQTAIVGTYGLGNPVVGVQELRNTVVDILELSNIRNTTRYFREVPPEVAKAVESAPKEPSPEMVMAQSAMEDVRSKTAVKVAEIRQKDEKIALEKDVAEANAHIAAVRVTVEDDFKRDKLNVDSFLALAAIAKDGILADAQTSEYVEPRNQEG